MAYETLLTELKDGIFTITINRPDKLNALNTAMIREFIDAFDTADADDAVRAIIVTGAGRAFCAGADLSTGGGTFDREARADRPPVPNGPDGKPDLSHDNARDGGGRITLRIFNCRKPVIAAVNGPAVGIGVTMLLAMDIRIASSECALRLRVLPARHRAGGGLELVPAAHRRHRAGAGVVFRAACSAPMRRSPAGWSAAWCRRAS